MQQYLKAFAAAIAAALAQLSVVLDGSSFSQVTDTQWVSIAIGVFGAFGAVWGIPNEEAPPET